MSLRSLSVIAVGLLLGCGGASNVAPPAAPMTSAAQPTGDKQSAEARLATAYNGPKIRVAVGEFEELEDAEELFDNMGWSGMAPGLTDQITTALVQSGRVAVLERQQIKKVTGNLETEGRLGKYFDKRTTAKSGKLLGAQAVLLGAITQFEPNVSGVSGGLQIPQLGGLTYHENKAVVGIDIRLVDQETGKVLVAAQGMGEIQSKNMGAAGNYAGVDFGGEAWSRTPLGVATRAAAEDAIRQLVDGIKITPWEGKVISASGQKVFIEAGHDLNLRPGDEFQLIRRGEAIRGPDGQLLGYDEDQIGIVVVKSVQEKMSIAELSDGGPGKTGDLVRLPVN